jgi:hypothetical protein
LLRAGAILAPANRVIQGAGVDSLGDWGSHQRSGMVHEPMAEARMSPRKYKYWDVFETLPSGWRYDKTAGSPLTGYCFAIDKSPLKGGGRILVKAAIGKEKESK